jgi:hypothetical protein
MGVAGAAGAGEFVDRERGAGSMAQAEIVDDEDGLGKGVGMRGARDGEGETQDGRAGEQLVSVARSRCMPKPGANWSAR